MSPTSYQTAPPRALSIAGQQPAAKFFFSYKLAAVG
jgi:hypothetical protein